MSLHILLGILLTQIGRLLFCITITLQWFCHFLRALKYGRAKYHMAVQKEFYFSMEIQTSVVEFITRGPLINETPEIKFLVTNREMSLPPALDRGFTVRFLNKNMK